LFLEIIAVYLIVQNNHYQKTVFLNNTNNLVGYLYETKNQVIEYFKLEKTNNELAKDNAKLKSLAFSSFQPLFGENIVLNDTVYFQQYTYMAAKIVNNSVNKRENYLTLNKGNLNNIEPGMGVISGKGVIGIVKNVSSHYATVISILHPKTSISAKFKKNQYFGSVVWDGKNYRYGKLKDIPLHVPVNKGDTIVTSGYSTIFPANIPIGVVVDFYKPEGENFFDITIEFTQDYQQLSYAYVVKNLTKHEQILLENLNQQEE
jgi:rod shape-determining protein MreC